MRFAVVLLAATALGCAGKPQPAAPDPAIVAAAPDTVTIRDPETERELARARVQLLERNARLADMERRLAEATTELVRAMARLRTLATRAEAASKEAQRIAPEAGETLYAQARILYYGYLDYPRALATLEEAAKSLPNSAEVTLTRALLYRRFGRWQEAYALFVRSSELNPRDLSAYIVGKSTGKH